MDLDQTRPFTRADAIKAGLDPSLLRGSGYRRLFRGLYVDATVADSPLLRAQAAVRVFGKKKVFASHATAARVHGLPVPALPGEHVTVHRAADRRDRAGIKVHVTRKAYVVDRGGIQVSSYEQTFVELAAQLTLVDLVVVGDHLVRRTSVTCAGLVDFCRESAHPAATAASRAAAFVRERVDSPMETRLRMLIVLAGLPEPEVNVTVRTEHGVPVRKYDLSYPEARAIIEYDGRHHIEREEQWEDDLERREAIDDDEWRILVVTAKGIYNRPEQTVLRVWRLLKARRLPGVPRQLSDEWRAHFPGRD